MDKGGYSDDLLIENVDYKNLYIMCFVLLLEESINMNKTKKESAWFVKLYGLTDNDDNIKFYDANDNLVCEY